MYLNRISVVKRPKIIIGLSGLLVLSSITLFTSGRFIFSQPESSVQQLDSLTRVEKLNDRTIKIRMGYDAITAIATKKGIVVIDAGISNGLTAKYRKIIENEFQRNDFAYLINTHGHPDHTGGNSIFSDAVIIGHENCAKEISNQWKDPERVKTSINKIINDYDIKLQALKPGTNEWSEAYCQKLRYENAYTDISLNYHITKPTSTFNDSLDIDMGDEKLNLIYFGKAHSESDIIIHIPARKILLVGDLFSKYGRPGIGDDKEQYADRWVKVIEWIECRLTDIDFIIGGHGQILSKEDLLSFNSYVRRSR